MKGYSLIAMLFIVLLFQIFPRLTTDSNEQTGEQQRLISRIVQGEDPSQLLTDAATGIRSSDFCDTHSYLYGTSIGGFRFVRAKGDHRFAVDAGHSVMLLQQAAHASYFSRLDPAEQAVDLAAMLSSCENSLTPPIPTAIHFVLLQQY